MSSRDATNTDELQPLHDDDPCPCDSHPDQQTDSKTDGTTDETTDSILDQQTDSHPDQQTDRDIDEPRVLRYTVSENPSVHLTLLFGLQVLLSLSRSLTVSFLVAELVCSGSDDVIRTRLLCSTLFMSGLCTFLQCTIGIRLPLYQGPSASYVVPLMAMATLEEWKCPAVHTQERTFNTSNSSLSIGDSSTSDLLEYRENVIVPKLQLLAGSLMIAGTVHTLIGATGLVGIVVQFIGPITIVPTLILICLFMIKPVIYFMSAQWGIGILTAVVTVILSLYLAKQRIPLPSWNRKRGLYFRRSNMHKMFSLLISITIGWVASYIMTVSGYFTDDPKQHQFFARTDARSNVISEMPWFYFPYPGQFGAPKLHAAVIFNFIVCTLLSVLDSIGDYYTCARVCLEKTPPSSGINRGILVEGVATVLSGAVGIGHSTSTLGGNIGAIGLTRVASLRVFQAVGLIYMLFGILSKVGAFFLSIPYSVLGGVQLTNFGILVGVVLSNLALVDLNYTRNTAIIGIALTVGMMMPYWTKLNPHGVDTGNAKADEVIMALLTNPSVVGGVLACFLDNTMPGTKKQRGLVGWQTYENDEKDEEKNDTETQTSSIYNLPFLPDFIRNSKLARHVPFLPMYSFNTMFTNCLRKQK